MKKQAKRETKAPKNVLQPLDERALGEVVGGGLINLPPDLTDPFSDLPGHRSYAV